VIGYGLWHNRFSGDPRVLDASINLNGVPYRCGVMPLTSAFQSYPGLGAAVSFQRLYSGARKTIRAHCARLSLTSVPGSAIGMNTIAARLEHSTADQHRPRHR